MTSKISDFQNRPVQTGADTKVSRTSTKEQLPAPAAASGSAVRITDQARHLAALEQAVASLPVVNEARVAEIRSSLDDGRYQIDPERIADKLLRTEQELAAR